MRFTMKCLCKVALFSVFLPLSCQVAQGSWSPLGVGLFFTDETQSPGIDDSVYGLNIGVFGSRLDEMKGLSVSSLATIADDMTGIVFSGIFNKTESAADGVYQVGGLFNIAATSVVGLQIAGMLNVAKDFAGVQIGGYMNEADTMAGVQIGMFNNHGLMIDNVGPFEGHCVLGAQFGAVNEAGDLSGLQLGVVNMAREVCGVQIGLVNVAEKSLRGVQIGALNFVRGSDLVFTPLLRVSF